MKDCVRVRVRVRVGVRIRVRVRVGVRIRVRVRVTARVRVRVRVMVKTWDNRVVATLTFYQLHLLLDTNEKKNRGRHKGYSLGGGYK